MTELERKSDILEDKHVDASRRIDAILYPKAKTDASIDTLIKELEQHRKEATSTSPLPLAFKLSQ